MRTRNNCFDLIRHFAALLVLFCHHFSLLGFAAPTLDSIKLVLSLFIFSLIATIFLTQTGFFYSFYGIYIYAFPTQQLVINLITHHFWLSMAISILFTLFAAYLSCRYVEKPLLYANAYQGTVKSKNVGWALEPSV